MRQFVASSLAGVLALFWLQHVPHIHLPGQEQLSTRVERACAHLPPEPHLHPSPLHASERCPGCAIGPVPASEQGEQQQAGRGEAVLPLAVVAHEAVPADACLGSPLSRAPPFVPAA